jgi:hypothetical protein
MARMTTIEARLRKTMQTLPAFEVSTALSAVQVGAPQPAGTYSCAGRGRIVI